MIDIVEHVFTSNLFLILFTFSLGGLIAFVDKNNYIRVVFQVVSVLVPVFLIISFILNIGETYQYNEYYKRAFFYFGDGAGGLLLFLILFSLFYGRGYSFYLLVIALSLTVSKVSFILFFVCIALTYYINTEYRKKILKCTLIAIPFAFCTYLTLAHISNTEISKNISVSIHSIYYDEINSIADLYNFRSYKRQNYKYCQNNYDCIVRQSSSALSDRYFSTIGGIWMTIEGGFMGRDVYPNTPDKFADLMMAVNPYGINTKYNLRYSDWYHMGEPQNPYIKLSSGYGLIGLFVHLLLVGVLAVLALMSLPRFRNNPTSLYLIFFLVYSLLNQTQIYITPFDYNLFILGLCAGWILKVSNFRRIFLSALSVKSNLIRSLA